MSSLTGAKFLLKLIMKCEVIILIKFKCSLKKDKTVEKWNARILDIRNYRSHQEIMIISQSSISFRVLIGETLTGYFACFPDLELSCHLSDYKDVFSNTNHLKKILSVKDSITVANGIRSVAQFSDEMGDEVAF